MNKSTKKVFLVYLKKLIASLKNIFKKNYSLSFPSHFLIFQGATLNKFSHDFLLRQLQQQQQKQQEAVKCNLSAHRALKK